MLSIGDTVYVYQDTIGFREYQVMGKITMIADVPSYPRGTHKLYIVELVDGYVIATYHYFERGSPKKVGIRKRPYAVPMFITRDEIERFRQEVFEPRFPAEKETISDGPLKL